MDGIQNPKNMAICGKTIHKTEWDMTLCLNELAFSVGMHILCKCSLFCVINKFLYLSLFYGISINQQFLPLFQACLEIWVIEYGWPSFSELIILTAVELFFT